MVNGVITDQVDQRCASAARVVQVGNAVSQAGAEVQQGGRRFARHAGVAIGSSRAHPLEQTEYRPHSRDGVDSLHHVHLGRARVREATLHAFIEQRSDQAFRAVHLCHTDSPGVKSR